jgi:hypothetical protein
MRVCKLLACVAGFTFVALAQQPTMPTKFGQSQPSASPAEAKRKEMFEAKVKEEWDALKNRDKKAYGELLAEDYQGVEVDGKGERNKTQALNELAETNVANYTLWGLSVIPLSEDAALITYEVTIQFPPRSAIRLSRVYISELWVKRAGQWKEVHYQETRVK